MREEKIHRNYTRIIVCCKTALLAVLLSCIFFEVSSHDLSGTDTIIVGLDYNYPPYEFLDINGEIAGFNVEITKEIAKNLNLKVEFRIGPWKQIRDAFREGEIHILNMYYSSERAKNYIYSVPHNIINHTIVARKGIDIPNNIDSLVKHTVVVEEGDIIHDILSQSGFEKQIVKVISYEEALQMVESGLADYAIVAKMIGRYYVMKNSLKNIVVSDNTMLSLDYCYAALPKNSKLVQDFSEGLRELKQTKKYGEIYSKWIDPLEDDSLTKKEIIKYLAFFLIPFLLIVVLGIVWTHTLRRKVAQRTSDLLAEIKSRKKIEKQLRKAKDKAEESERLKTAFLANMSHEVRTPMNGILGFTNLLKDTEITGEKQQEYIDLILKGGDRMLSTVNDIIEISKIETGQVKLSLVEVDALALITNLGTFFKPEADEKRIGLVCQQNISDSRLILKTDEAKLNSIFTNLLKNAIKYTDSGFVKLSYKKKKGHVRFSIKDTGIGISPERQEAIFNRFEQADINDTRAYEGSGLGLAITKSYLDMLGGKIWLKSEKGVGSTFYFTLPYSEIHSDIKLKDPVSLDRIKQPSEKKLNILIAEDDEVSYLHLSILLENSGYTVSRAKTGIEALAKFNTSEKYDLILMDLKMPDLNGYKTTRKIREIDKDVVIIAQTAFALIGDKEKALEAGCNDYISKPIVWPKLEKLLQKYF